MKKILAVLLGIMMYGGTVQAQEVTVLPQPQIKGGTPLMEVIDLRKSERDFENKKIDTQTLSEVLWVAYGKNSHGTRTIPTARNQLDMNVYAIMGSGAYLYDGEKHSLTKVSDKDLRPMLAQQDYVKDAALTLVYTGKDANYAAMHAGSSYQNVGLYAAYKGLKNVVRGLFDKEEVGKALGLKDGEKAVVSTTLGY